MTSFMLGMRVMFENQWNGVNEAWVSFVLFIGITFVATLFNVVACRKNQILPMFNNGIFYQNVALLLAFSITLLVCAGAKSDKQYQSARFVFGGWINQTGWSDGVTWFIGLIQA